MQVRDCNFHLSLKRLHFHSSSPMKTHGTQITCFWDLDQIIHLSQLPFSWRTAASRSLKRVSRISLSVHLRDLLFLVFSQRDCCIMSAISLGGRSILMAISLGDCTRSFRSKDLHPRQKSQIHLLHRYCCIPYLQPNLTRLEIGMLLVLLRCCHYHSSSSMDQIPRDHLT